MKKLLPFILALLTLETFAQPGSLDPAFNSTGKITTSLFPTDFDQAYSVAVQADGKIVVAGTTNNGSKDVIAVVRYNANGTLDNTFNGTGMVSTSNGGARDEAHAVVIQADGKILVMGDAQVVPGGGPNMYGVVRYNSNGSLDNTFANGGKRLTAIGTSQDFAYAMAVQPDGKILVTGSSYFTGQQYSDVSVIRYNSNGTLDGTFFGPSGCAVTNLGTQFDRGSAIAVQADGKIVVGSGARLIRYTTGGKVDSTFGTAGIAITKVGSPYGQTDELSLKILSSGKILVGGTNTDNSYDFAVQQLNANGSVDSAFGINGLVLRDVDGSSDRGTSIAIQQDGKIVLGGYDYYDFVLARYNSNGSTDSSFGTNGIIKTDFTSSTDKCKSVAMLPNGKIVGAGHTNPNNGGFIYEIAVAVYLSGLNLGVLDFSAQANSALVYPNPIQNNAVLEYSLTKDEVISIGIHDINGRLVQPIIAKEEKSKGEQKQKLNINEALPAGNYLLVITNGSQNLSVKIIKR